MKLDSSEYKDADMLVCEECEEITDKVEVIYETVRHDYEVYEFKSKEHVEDFNRETTIDEENTFILCSSCLTPRISLYKIPIYESSF